MPNRHHRTHLSRAARILQQRTNLTYQQALVRLRTAESLPDLGDPDAVDAFVDSYRSAPAHVCTPTPGWFPAVCSGCGKEIPAVDGDDDDNLPEVFYVESGTGDRLSADFTVEADARAVARQLGERLVGAIRNRDGFTVEDRLVDDFARPNLTVLDDENLARELSFAEGFADDGVAAGEAEQVWLEGLRAEKRRRDAAAGPANTEINFLYRDASNYKQAGSVVLTGRITDAERAALEDSLEGGNGFIPTQVGLGHLGFDAKDDGAIGWDGFPSDDDHVWHELTEVELTDKAPTDSRTISQFVEEMARQRWDDTVTVKDLLPGDEVLRVVLATPRTPVASDAIRILFEEAPTSGVDGEAVSCVTCGGDVEEDPDGSDGIWVHARDGEAVDGYDGYDAWDLDADHVALPDLDD